MVLSHYGKLCERLNEYRSQGISSTNQKEGRFLGCQSYRWFIGYDIDTPIPHFATISYAFATRFPSEVFEDIFTWILETADAKGFIKTETISTLLQSTVANLQKQTGIPISCETKLKDETLHVDTDIVQRVLENSLSNAARYADSKISVSAYCQDMHLVLSVTDDGEGFSKEYLDRPFIPFYQAHKPGHFGLGLNICKTLCQNHDGDLKIVNTANGGANVMASFKTR